jgi:deoxyribonuclease-4
MPQALVHATQLGCTAIQIFVKNQRQWTGRMLPVEEAAAFRTALGSSSVRHALAHGSYLANLASPDDMLQARSVATLAEEMRRCVELGIEALVVHPGAHQGSGEPAGLRRVAAGVREILALPGLQDVALLLECTAGQGTSVGHRLEHLRQIIEDAGGGARLGVCLDTCHLFAAAYDLRTPPRYEEVMREVEAVIGLERVRAFHLNDSRTRLGARVDRHAPIGAGRIGRAAFARLVADERFAAKPMVLEVPGGMEGYRRDLAALRRMLRRQGAIRPRSST